MGRHPLNHDTGGIPNGYPAFPSRRASDIFIIAGLPVTFKVNGQLLHADDGRLTPSDTQALIQGAYALAGRDIAISESGDDDFSFALQGVSRFRISAARFARRGHPRHHL